MRLPINVPDKNRDKKGFFGTQPNEKEKTKIRKKKKKKKVVDDRNV